MFSIWLGEGRSLLLGGLCGRAGSCEAKHGGHFFLAFIVEGPFVGNMLVVNDMNRELVHVHIIEGAHSCSINEG